MIPPGSKWHRVAAGCRGERTLCPRATGPESLNGGVAYGEEIGIAGGRC